ncbi:LPXTG cell wall anchor domain-containing protein [Bacillus cereus group sp. BfR-BA-01380]|uniref:LPXTG cell wall anchor domain-containing protein n=1 Tax=Bacillus cereus group sp. BfR-BA-01380 TaxID=2920324 RepID=UPI001F5ACE7B|nr:LPXTG cell wall anchor domain-containing protein [Bacillus cereus group sp. BfR-BA-01380]
MVSSEEKIRFTSSRSYNLITATYEYVCSNERNEDCHFRRKKENVNQKELESKQTNASETAQKQESKSEQPKPVQEQKPTEQTKPVQEQSKTAAPPSQENKPTPQQTAPTKEEKLKEDANQQAPVKQTISEIFPDATIASAIASELGKKPDDKVTEEELQQVTELSIANEGTFTSLQGFHLLPNLEDLNLYANNKVNTALPKSSLSIDLSNNKKLKHLAIGNLGINALSLPENKDLQSLGLENNQIAVLDVSNQTKLIALSAVHNGIKELRLPKESKLETLDVSNNNLTNLNLENQVALQNLLAEHNALSSIQFNPNVMLHNVQLNNNALTDLPNLNTSNLIYLNIEENKFNLKNGPFAKKHLELLQQDFKPNNEQKAFGYHFDYQFSTHSDRPDAPVVLADMKSKKILGVSQHMEYSLDEGKTWNDFVINGYLSAEEGKKALIRYKKTDKWLESEATKLVFSQTDNTNNGNGNNNNSGNSNSGNNNSNNNNNGNSNSGNNNSNNSNTNGTGQVNNSTKSQSLPETGSAVETTGIAGALALLGAWFLRRKAQREE